MVRDRLTVRQTDASVRVSEGKHTDSLSWVETTGAVALVWVAMARASGYAAISTMDLGRQLTAP